MQNAKVTYHAAEGEADAVTTRGVRFFDGHPVDLNTNDHGALIAKAKGNPHFEVEMGEEVADEPKPKRGRKPADEPKPEAE